MTKVVKKGRLAHIIFKEDKMNKNWIIDKFDVIVERLILKALSL